MQIQSTHSAVARNLDAYFTPIEAIISLIHLEKDHIPKIIWEPACGNGAISIPLKENGYEVYSSDIFDYNSNFPIADYLTTPLPSPKISAVITNPPYKLALEFIQKSISSVPYSAFLLRTNFLESIERYPFFKKSPFSKLYISSRRLPMMHRLGWTGPIAPSNTCYAWFIWDKNVSEKTTIHWFDYKEFYISTPKSIQTFNIQI